MRAVGLSVGTTSLTAVTSDNAVRKPPVLMISGQPITDFVDRVGDPVGILAADGSSHRAEQLLARALRDIAFDASRGQVPPDVAAVSVPAHWRGSAVDALSRALSRVPEWSRRPPVVLSEVAAAVTALQTDPGLPIHGVVAVCDFGGTGAAVTLVDADHGFTPIGDTVRHPDFAGDMIDQALLTHVIGELAGTGSVDLNSTSAIGSLWRLRAQCRRAKERLSAGAVTALPVELPEFRGDIRITRTELDELVREPLSGFVDVIHDTLRRNGIHPADLAAVASVGGGAAMSAVTTTLSESLRVPVVTRPRPELIAATGAALRALRGPADDTATALAKAVPVAAPVAGPVAAPSEAATALAWSEVPDEPELSGLQDYHLDWADTTDGADGGDAPLTGVTGARPMVEFEYGDDAAVEQKLRWYRRPAAVMVAAVVVMIAAVSATGVVLASDAEVEQVSDPTPSIAGDPPPPAPEPAVAQPVGPAPHAPAQQPAVAPPARTVVATQAPVTRTQVVQSQSPPVTVEAPPPEPAAPVTSTVTQTVTPTPTPTPAPTPREQTPPSTPAPQEPAPNTPEPSAEAPPPPSEWIPTIPPIPTIPGLPPFVPQPGQAQP